MIDLQNISQKSVGELERMIADYKKTEGTYRAIENDHQANRYASAIRVCQREIASRNN